MRQRLTLLLVGTLAVGAAACGAQPDDALALVSGGAAAEPVIAVIDTTTTTTAPPPPPEPVAVRSAASVSPRVARAPKPAPHLVVIGRLLIPRLGLDTDVYEGDSLDVVDHGPGHLSYTAMPGRVGNVVLAGHRVTHSKPFRHLDTLQVGDTATFVVPSGQYTYSFTGHEVVTPDRVDITNQTLDYTATFFACHPPGSARYRLVSRWKLTSPPEPGQPDPASFAAS